MLVQPNANNPQTKILAIQTAVGIEHNRVKAPNVA
jgi:hypothetical protein